MSSGRVSLDVIHVAEPCHESWEKMAGDERVRFCDGCNKHVYNLSAMSRPDAERLVCEAAGPLCVRFARADDGAVQTLEYRAPTKRPRGWRFWTAVGTAAAALVAGVNAYVLARGRPAPPPALLTTLGKVAAPPTVVMGGACPPGPAAATRPAPR